MKTRSNKKQSAIQLSIALISILLLNVIGSFLFKRFDLTSEKRYTLSDATKKLLTELEDVVYIKIYLEGEFPAGFKRLRNETKEMIDEFRAYGEDNIQYEFINPNESSDEAQKKELYKQLYDHGLKPTDLQVKGNDGQSQQIIFPGALLSYRSREVPLQLLKSIIGAQPEEMLNNSIQGLEYEISNSIRKLTNNNKPKIAFIDGHGELDTLQTYDIMKSLQEYYLVERVTLNEQLNSLLLFKAAVIAKPDSAFSEKDKFIIDQFIMKGGKILWLIDPMFATLDSLKSDGSTIGISNSLNLDDQLFKYGVRLNSNLIMDIQAAPIPIVTGQTGNQPQQQLFPWYYYPLAFPTSSHPIVNNLNAVRFEFASSIDTLSNKGVKKTILLESSKYTKLKNSPVNISLGIVRFKPKMEQFNKANQAMAVLLEGKFQSVFKNRVTPQVLKDSAIQFKAESGPNKMIIVGDGDIIKNEVKKGSNYIIPLGIDKYTREEYGNKNFILNCMNYLLDDSGLISVRSRVLKLRLLDQEAIEKNTLQWKILNTVFPILFIILLGFIQNAMRKRKYAR